MLSVHITDGAFDIAQAQGQNLLTKLNNLAEQLRTHHLHAKLPELRVLLYQCAGHLVKSKKVSNTAFLNCTGY